MVAANGPGSVGNPAGRAHRGGILPRSAQWPDPLQRPQPSQSRVCPKGSPKFFPLHKPLTFGCDALVLNSGSIHDLVVDCLSTNLDVHDGVKFVNNGEKSIDFLSRKLYSMVLFVIYSLNDI